MRFGVCCGLDEARLAVEVGFHYVEIGAHLLVKAPDLAPYRELPIEATNLFFPPDIVLFGPQRTPYLDYARAAVETAAGLGVKTMVVGSGAARNAPEGVEIDDVNRRFVDIVAEIQEVARNFGIRIAPESLNRSETNVGNDLGRLAASLGARGVGYTADSYHVLFEWNEDSPISGFPPDSHWRAQLPTAPAHVHIADLPRNVPTASDPMVIGFADRLRELLYDGRISLECRRDDPASDLPRALRELELLFRRG